MSKSNVNPNHYKVAGRERQGEDIAQARHKQKHAEGLVAARRGPHARFAAAPKAAVPRPAAAVPTPATKKVSPKATAKRAAARKATAKKATKHPTKKARAATRKG
jgi:hypothetical protein